MYTALIRPILFKFGPETAHKLTFQALKAAQSVPGGQSLLSLWTSNAERPISLMGLNFRNRIGVAAGLDKNAEVIPAWRSLGFGFAEIGTVTPKAQPGNPKPRLFRLPEDKALINRMGFNNHGLQRVVQRLKSRPSDFIVGGNIGKNTLTPNEEAVNDYLQVFNGLYPYVDYLVINVSCPNISDLSKLQDKAELEAILKQIMAERADKLIKKPVLLKVSPDLNNMQLTDTLQLVADYGLSGIIATNTSIRRNKLKTNSNRLEQIGRGGLSGFPLTEQSTQIIRLVKKEMGNDFPVIASGGIVNLDEAKRKIDDGADMLQLYTGFIYQGIGLVNNCLQM